MPNDGNEVVVAQDAEARYSVDLRPMTSCGFRIALALPRSMHAACYARASRRQATIRFSSRRSRSSIPSSSRSVVSQPMRASVIETP